MSFMGRKSTEWGEEDQPRRYWEQVRPPQPNPALIQHRSIPVLDRFGL